MPKGRKNQAASNENETKSSTQSTTATAHNIAEPPAWLQQLLIVQQTQMEQMQAQAQQVQQAHMEQMQAQAQQVQQAHMEQINQLFAQLIQTRHDSINREHESSEQSLARNSEQHSSNARRSKADAPKPPILNVDISVAEFSKWRKLYNDYVIVSEAHELPRASQIALLRSFFSLELRDAVEHVLLIPDDTELDTNAILEKVHNYIRSQRNIALDCVAFEERKQAVGESFDSFLIAIKTLARDADLCNACIDRRLVTKIMSGICDKQTRTKLLAISPLPDLETTTAICRSKESARLDDARIDNKKFINLNRYKRGRSKSKPRKPSCTRCGNMICPPKGQGTCPAREKICSSCNKKDTLRLYAFQATVDPANHRATEAKPQAKSKKCRKTQLGTLTPMQHRKYQSS